jgi:hypothetical protein
MNVPTAKRANKYRKGAGQICKFPLLEHAFHFDLDLEKPSFFRKDRLTWRLDSLEPPFQIPLLETISESRATQSRINDLIPLVLDRILRTQATKDIRLAEEG